ncbi:MAG: DUF6715 family protein [Eubacterium sp.]
MERRMPKRHIQQTQAPAKKMAKNITSFAFLAGLLIIIAIAFFYAHKDKEESVTTTNNKMSEAEKLISKDLEVGYPETPTEVMKLFGRINQCIYNSNMADEQFDALLNQMRLLYSNSLISQNSFEEQRDNLKDEIEAFRKSKRRIANYTVEKSSSIKYKTIENQDCAFVQMAYFMSEKGDYTKSFQDYILVKENGKWKILSFQKDISKETEEKKG